MTSPKDKEHKVRIRYNSNSVVATPEQEKELYVMAAREPFDMIGNLRASIDDISEILLTEEVDIVKFPEGSINNPNSFIEVPPIKGAVPQIIKRTLDKIQDMTIENRLDKVPIHPRFLR